MLSSINGTGGSVVPDESQRTRRKLGLGRRGPEVLLEELCETRHAVIQHQRTSSLVWWPTPQWTLADSYFTSTASLDKTLPRYNVNTFLNSATTGALPFGSVSL
jgi:hypothetical protein